MGQNWVFRNDEMPSSLNMAKILQTSPNTATAATPVSEYAMPSTAIGAVSSWRITTSSMMGLRTCPEKSSHLLIYATNHLYSQVAPWRFQRKVWPGPKPNSQRHNYMPQNRRATHWSVTSRRIGLTVFMTCVLWTRMLSPFRRRNRKVSSRGRTGKKKEDVLGGMPPETSTFLDFCRLCWWATLCGGFRYP